MASALCFLIFAAFAWQVRGRELESVRVNNLISDTTEDDAILQRFKCGKDGLYPNDRNCSTFIQCSNGIAHVMPCPKGLHFSVEKQRCEGPCNAHCDKSIACKCQWPTCGKEICFLPPKVGTCRGMFPRFYFDKRDKVCKKFVYGGCRGNENSFETKEECDTQCGDALESTKRDICKLPKKPGTCRGKFERYYFNSKSGKCEKFTYGGCEKNGNNFATIDECKKRCVKTQEAEDLEEFECGVDGLYPNKRNCSTFIQCSNGNPHIMPCPAGLHFSNKTQRCESKCDARCDRTLACKCKWETCGKENCHLSPETGSCSTYTGRYYFEKSTGLCKPFNYSGCLGNENNFEKKIDCENNCNNTLDFCQLPSNPGTCYAKFDRYYFNSKKGKCEKFIWGGCGGNANNFVSEKECKSKCPKKSEAEGLEDFECGEDGLYPNKRNCSTYIQCSNGNPHIMPCPKGLHYSTKTKRCESQCDAQCDRTLACKCKWKTCGKENCLQSPATGSCHNYKVRYYFEKSTGFCKPFVYSGCLGNENNFEKKIDCEKNCNNSMNICRLSSETGNCDGKFNRFYFNSKKGKCEKFVWGGCGGNANNFDSVKKCQLKCLRKSATDAEKFGCIQNGTYPDPDDCNQYVDCYTNGTLVYHKCPTGKHYSVSLKRCMPECEAYCEPSIACRCKWPNCKEGESSSEESSEDFKEEPIPAECHSQPVKGKCFGRIPRWNYDQQKGKCVKFVYGGCGGNGNNYKSEKECKEHCSKHSDGVGIRDPECVESKIPSFCNLPKVEGNCQESLRRWYFDNTSGECKEFSYSGCGGNNNRFWDKRHCETECKPNTTESASSEDSGWEGEPEPECDSPPEVGPCRGRMERWYYNKEEGKCSKFYYGGCGGNGNRYLTEEQCKKQCSKHSAVALVPAVPKLCSLPLEVGSCSGSHEMFYFDSEDKECKNFNYTGCGGNANRFWTKLLCEKTCNRDKKDSEPTLNGDLTPDCDSPAEVGECRARIKSWYYNKEQGKCIKFYYGGCGGNGNRYVTEEECKKQCSEHSADEVCALPVDSGPCHDRIRRYFFNTESGMCEPFTYGGCEGNRNNFPSTTACQKYCLRRTRSLELACPKPNGNFFYIQDCRKYISCKRGKAELKTCPEGKAFGIVEEECIPEKDAACL